MKFRFITSEAFKIKPIITNLSNLRTRIPLKIFDFTQHTTETIQNLIIRVLLALLGTHGVRDAIAFVRVFAVVFRRRNMSAQFQYCRCQIRYP